MALDYFEDEPYSGARAILLVSDGGAHLDHHTRDLIRQSFHHQQASLYWVYLRSAHGASLMAAPADEEADAYPEYQLHEYFQTLGVPYQVYEAENPKAVREAMADIARLKNHPVKYFETGPRHDLSGVFYLLAWLCVVLVLALHLLEVKQWRTA